MSRLSYAGRLALPDSAFALPERREFPLDTIGRARNSLARVSAFGSERDKQRVRAAVRERYPEVHVSKRHNPRKLSAYNHFVSSLQRSLPHDASMHERAAMMKRAGHAWSSGIRDASQVLGGGAVARGHHRHNPSSGIPAWAKWLGIGAVAYLVLKGQQPNVAGVKKP